MKIGFSKNEIILINFFRDKKLKLKTAEDGDVNLKLRIWDTGNIIIIINLSSV